MSEIDVFKDGRARLRLKTDSNTMIDLYLRIAADPDGPTTRIELDDGTPLITGLLGFENAAKMVLTVLQFAAIGLQMMRDHYGVKPEEDIRAALFIALDFARRTLTGLAPLVGSTRQWRQNELDFADFPFASERAGVLADLAVVVASLKPAPEAA